MGCFKGPSPKRHVGWSNHESFMADLMAKGGFLSVADRTRLQARLAKKGTRNGVPTFTGCKQLMKKSQHLSLNLVC